MRIAVAIPSRGRPTVLADALRSLREQQRPADEVWLAVTAPEDLPADVHDDPTVRVVISPVGSALQRNAIIDRLSADVDLVVFLDDDAELHPDYLARAAAFARARPDVALFTGQVVVDGAATGEIDRPTARAALATATDSELVTDGVPGYGCNMVARGDVAREVRFDDRLPLYAWLEDRDFSVRASRLGKVVRYSGCRAAHLGFSGGRCSGVRLGYQQVVHPWYLHDKGVLTRREASWFIARAVAGNVLHAGSGRIDRPGRLRGNLHGLRDAVQAGADPARVFQLAG